MSGKPKLENWTNARAGLIGFLTGRGCTASEIEEILDDTTTGETIRRKWAEWGLPLEETGGRRRKVELVPLSAYHRRLLSERAVAAGVAPEEWVRRVIVTASAERLYRLITDGRFDIENSEPL